MMPVDQFQEAVKSAEVYSGEADPVPGQYYKSGSGKLFIANEDGTLIPVQPGTAP